jgi:hypothetical protein
MLPTIRRMLEGTAMLRQSEGEGGTPEPEAGATNAGGDTGEPEAGSPSAEPGTAAEGTGEAEASTTPASSEAPPAAGQPDPAQRRVNQLVAERWAERRRAEAAEQQSRLLQEQLNQTRQALQAQPQVDADGNPVQPQPQRQPPTQPPQDLQAMAAQIAAQNEFNRQVGDEVSRGRTIHQNFDQVAANLQRFGELPRTFVEAALATGKGADVMYALGSDIAEADRILSMPPMQQAVAIAQLAGGLKAPEPPKKTTSAPAPIVPKVGGGSGKNTPSLEDPNLPVADWIKLREKNLPKRASR